MLSISIIGVGRLGGALAIALTKAGFHIDRLVYRRREPAEVIAAGLPDSPALCSIDELPGIDSDIILIATNDTEIAAVARRLTNKSLGTPIVLHTSGSTSSEILEPLAASGISTGSLHPLVSVSDPAIGATRFAKAYFCIEGESEAIRVATELAVALGGKPFTIPRENKALYHAGAVTAAGHVVALFDIAVELLERSGLDKEKARAVLLPLLRSAADNLDSQPTERALTGTFARADADGFDRHMNALAGMADEIISVYLSLGLRSLSLAERAGVEAGKVAALRERILMAKRNRE